MPGPFIQLATFCDAVLEEKDGTISVIRAVDRVVVVLPPNAPPELPGDGLIGGTLVVAFKSGDARGRYPVKVRPEQPSGIYLPDQTFDVTFEGEDRGVNLVLKLTIPAVEGLHWFDVLVNDALLTRVPLRVMYQRAPRSG